jgi:hypothetical protein
VLRRAQVPQQAALFHNDCAFLAERLLAAGYVYAPGLAAAAPSAPAQFVDAAQRLRAAGAAVLREQARAPTSMLSACKKSW